MDRDTYEEHLDKQQRELSRLQSWVQRTGARVIIVFEGRDAAGKGGAIRALTEKVSKRVFRTVALPAPSDRQKTQLYFQRYMEHFPAAGEVILFDRSWYNRAGVEIVMGFCTEEERDIFLEQAPKLERALQRDGVILLKYWLEVGSAEQKQRFESRIENPVKQWKLSPMDLEARRRWYEYSLARDRMLDATDTDAAPWHIVRSDDKREARLNLISHLLSVIPYHDEPMEAVVLPSRSKKYKYDDKKSMADRRYIPEPY